MFTGIVQGVGRALSLENGVLTVQPPEGFAPDGYDSGESVAVNGCCLTVVRSEAGLRFDLSPETLARTALGALLPGDAVSLERALRADARLGGHFVQGHVDATGTLVSITPSGNASVYRFEAPAEYGRYLIDKGSVAVDGISLTVVSPQGSAFDTWIIPHTLEGTHLGRLRPGDRVNLEFDVLAKYVERLIAARETS